MNKKIYYIIFFIVFIFVFNSKIKSLTYGGCEYSEISRLKSFTSNINITYDYYIYNNQAYFNVTLNNIVPGMYFIDSTTGIKYNYSDTNDGEITINGYSNSGGNYKFYSSLDKCYGVKLGNKYYSFPTYNRYYENELCKENKNYSLCQKWIKVTYSYDEFKKKIEDYNKNNQISDEQKQPIVVYNKTVLDILVGFYVKYYYVILISIIVICAIIMVINRRKNKFDI